MDLIWIRIHNAAPKNVFIRHDCKYIFQSLPDVYNFHHMAVINIKYLKNMAIEYTWNIS